MDMRAIARFDRGLDYFAVLVDDMTAPFKDVVARSVGTILANNKCLERLVVGRRAFLACHFDDGSGHRYFFGSSCPLRFALRLWLRKRQRGQQCAADEDGNWFLHVYALLLMLMLYVTVGFPLQRDSQARAAGNLDLCRLRLIFWNLERSR